MAIIGGYILIVLGAIALWVALASKFSKIGKKVTDKIDVLKKEMEKEDYK